MPTNVAIHAPKGHLAPRNVRVADDYLRSVLDGEASLLFDGGMGTMLQEVGLSAGQIPELLCITEPTKVAKIHAAYVDAGSDVVTTNTFGANARKLAEGAHAAGLVRVPTVAQVFQAAVSCARSANPRYVAADIGPTGSLLRPLGTMSFDEAYDLFAEQVCAAHAAGADLFVIETMADLLEAKAAVLAAKENSDLPIFCTMTFGEDGRTFLGTTPEVAAATLSALGVDVLGINCSLGPADVAPLVERMLPWATCPVMVQANAGLPSVVDGQTTYDVEPEAYCEALAPLVQAGVKVLGGCCGTNPAYIAGEKTLLKEAKTSSASQTTDERPANANSTPDDTSRPFVVTSAQQLFCLKMGEVGVIGERINPTGKKRLKEALRTSNYDYILNEAIGQEQAGAQVLDVNAGLPEIDEPATLVRLVEELQGVTTLPLQIDSTDPVAIEAAVRIYPGKPIINSVNGKKESLDAILPLVRHYGCAIVALTLDEEGIPASAKGRLDVAQRIVAACDRWGIPREDILVDCLTMAASTNQDAPRAILDAVRATKAELPGVRTVLGVSNISFGLPYRELLNATFLTAAFAAGLDMAIMNPLSRRFMDAVGAWRVLNKQDKGAQAYIAANTGRKSTDGQAPEKQGEAVAHEQDLAASTPEQRIGAAVIQGRKEPVEQGVRELLTNGVDPLRLVNSVLVPALDEVGKRFEEGTFFLPQLMASAEAAKAGFNVVRDEASAQEVSSKGAIAIATVKGDIHDIGKNIVKMLLENYGYQVHDLGRDVEPQAFVDEVVRHHIALAGLSALMTTTVPAMAQTIELLRAQAPWCKVMVGGAVLNPEYARMVGADYYAKDASEAAHIAAEVLQ